jgi:hypothetical protein
MTILDKRRGLGEGSDAAQQAAQRGFDANVPDHVKTGVKLTGIVLSPAHGLTVPHKLGRVPVGWHTLRAQGPKTGTGSEVHESSADKNTITFIRPGGTADFTYDFWVF